MPPSPTAPTRAVDWEALYEELGETVFRMIDRITGDPALAEDLTHDTFVKVHERRHQYAGHGSLHGWVCRIARNLALSSESKRSNRVRLLRREAPVLERERGPRSGGTENRLLLEEALDRLSPGRRAALLLHVVDGYSHGEIGRMLGIAEGTSKARVSLAKADLRKMLDQKA